MQTDRQRRQGRQRVERQSIHIPLPPLSTELCAVLLRSIIKHVLYSRGQLPILYDRALEIALCQAQELQQRAQQPAGGPRTRRPRLKKAEKKLLQFFARAEALMDSIGPGLFSADHPTRCLLLLGPSAARPRESYELLFPPTAPSAAAPEVPAGAQDAGARWAEERGAALSRLAIRQFVVASMEGPEGTAAQRSCKVFLLISSPLSSSGGAGGGTSANSSGGGPSTSSSSGGSSGSSSMPASSQPRAPPPDFIVRPGYRLSMRRGLHTTLLLGPAQEHALAQQQQQQQQVAAAPGTAQEQEPAQQQQQQAAAAAKGALGLVGATSAAGSSTAAASKEPWQQQPGVWLQSRHVLQGLHSGQDSSCG